MSNHSEHAAHAGLASYASEAGGPCGAKTVPRCALETVRHSRARWMLWRGLRGHRHAPRAGSRRGPRPRVWHQRTSLRASASVACEVRPSSTQRETQHWARKTQAGPALMQDEPGKLRARLVNARRAGPGAVVVA